MDQTQTPESVATRLKEQFAPAHLTLTSIIQGVALSTLVIRVEATYEHFMTADWLLAVATLLAFLVVWHEYLMQALAFVWLPTLIDSLVPFGFLTSELFMAHFVYGSQRAWLLATGIGFVVGVLARSQGTKQARIHVQENRGVLAAVAGSSRTRLALTVAPAALFLGAWALYDLLGLGRVQTAIAAVSVIAMIAIIGGTVPYWNHVLAYARSARPTVEAD
jgi:hypothetical protein